MEKPILFSTEMVHALLDGKKTQTRRLVKMYKHDDHPLRQNSNWLFENKTCPYGITGDLLWVREEHLITFSDDAKWISVEFKGGYKFTTYYKELSLNLLERLYKRKTIGKWQRSRFLPKELARIWLSVTNVRVERLKDISITDAVAEGVEKVFSSLFQEYRFKDYANVKDDWRSAISSFQSLWASINGFDSWDENPWVWVVEFELVSTTGRNNVKEVQL